MSDLSAPDPHTRLGEYLIPAQARSTQCASCHAAIVWAKTGTGANMPLSLATVRQDDQGRHWALTHFADCPSAAQHRKPSELPKGNPATGKPVDLRDLPDYLARNGLVVTGSSVSDDGNGKLLIVLQTRKA